jgi:hypothetical protein
MAAPPSPATTTPTSTTPPPTAGGVGAGGAAVGAPSAQKGSPILKIIVAIVAFFVLITVAGIGTCVYIAYKAKQKVTQFAEAARTPTTRAGTPEIRMEKGGEGSEAAAAATEEVPPYPGATATKGGGTLSFGGMGGFSAQEYVTDDTMDKVLAFYKEKLGSKLQLHESEGKAMFQVSTKKGLTTVTIVPDEKAGKTKITISRIGK